MHPVWQYFLCFRNSDFSYSWLFSYLFSSFPLRIFQVNELLNHFSTPCFIFTVSLWATEHFLQLSRIFFKFLLYSDFSFFCFSILLFSHLVSLLTQISCSDWTSASPSCTICHSTASPFIGIHMSPFPLSSFVRSSWEIQLAQWGVQRRWNSHILYPHSVHRD